MTSLLPPSSGRFELAFEASHSGRWAGMWDAVPYITTMKDNPPPAALPFLVYEFGLGMLTPYVANPYELLDGRGVRWLRVRGTYDAIDRGLAFLGLTATVEPAWHGRIWWNSSQLRFSALPSNDVPLLGRIEGITRLSLPFRSDFRRGTHEYDVGPALGDHARLDSCMLEHESGIRLHGGGTIWSFGRLREADHVLTEEEGTAIGNWIEPPEGGLIPWTAMNYPWAEANFSWSETPETQRRALMAAWFGDQVLYLTLRDTEGEIIGHRRCRARWPVKPQFDGPYQFGGTRYQPAPGGTRVYIEAMTDFDDADGVVASGMAITVGATRAEGIPPGRAWLDPGDLIGGEEIAVTATNTPLRKTVRDRVKLLLRF
ncbi:phage tail protein [Shinella sp. NM-101]|uniref:phage tail protein n=1 Tax=Shinella sp. NM-101 TaxID=2744455 RepID=UPI001F2FD389|nr:phage tail protein [Shinella sp. NM-101]